MFRWLDGVGWVGDGVGLGWPGGLVWEVTNSGWKLWMHQTTDPMLFVHQRTMNSRLEKEGKRWMSGVGIVG